MLIEAFELLSLKMNTDSKRNHDIGVPAMNPSDIYNSVFSKAGT